MLKWFERHTSWRWLLLLSWGLLALVLTTQSVRVPLVGLAARTIGKTEIGAAVGHVALFSVLTAVLYLALVNLQPRARALLAAIFIALFLGVSTEFWQILVAGRDASLTDLLANALGVFVTAFLVCFWWELRRT